MYFHYLPTFFPFSFSFRRMLLLTLYNQYFDFPGYFFHCPCNTPWCKTTVDCLQILLQFKSRVWVNFIHNPVIVTSCEMLKCLIDNCINACKKKLLRLAAARYPYKKFYVIHLILKVTGLLFGLYWCIVFIASCPRSDEVTWHVEPICSIWINNFS